MREVAACLLIFKPFLKGKNALMPRLLGERGHQVADGEQMSAVAFRRLGNSVQRFIGLLIVVLSDLLPHHLVIGIPHNDDFARFFKAAYDCGDSVLRFVHIF